MDWSSRIGRRVKLRDLHILLTVANCASMTKAARELAVSNPVISKAIAELEHVTGARLLERGSHGVELTVYGRALVRHGLTVFDELRQAVGHIEFLADPTVGELRIGATIMLAAGIVTSIVEALTKRFPRMTFHLIAGDTGTVYAALEHRRVDLVVTRLVQPTVQDDFQSEILHEEADVVVAGRSNPLARRRRVGLADLVSEPWVLQSYDSLTGSIAAEAFRKAGLELPVQRVVTATAPARLALVAEGRFLTIVQRSMLRFGVGKNLPVVTLPIDLQTKRRPVGIVTLRNRTPNPIAPLFVSEARKLAARLKL
jgi:DNA-binding transcriptional LysR family regulator